MKLILAYVQKGKDDKVKHTHAELIDSLNNKYMSGIFLVAIHASVLTLSEPKIQIIMCTIFVFIIFWKLYRYCMFMQYPKKYGCLLEVNGNLELMRSK